MSAALFEIAVHMGMELYSGNDAMRKQFIDWYIETNGGTIFPLDNLLPSFPGVSPCGGDVIDK